MSYLEEYEKSVQRLKANFQIELLEDLIEEVQQFNQNGYAYTYVVDDVVRFLQGKLDSLKKKA